MLTEVLIILNGELAQKKLINQLKFKSVKFTKLHNIKYERLRTI